MGGGVEEGEHSAEAVAVHGDLADAAGPHDGVDRPGHVIVDVGRQAVVGVEVVGNAPVEDVHVEAPAEHGLDQAVAGPQVEDVAAAHQAHHHEDRRFVRALITSVTPQFHLVVVPDGVLRREADAGPVDAGRVLDAVAESQDVAFDLPLQPLGHLAGAVGRCRIALAAKLAKASRIIG